MDNNEPQIDELSSANTYKDYELLRFLGESDFVRTIKVLCKKEMNNKYYAMKISKNIQTENIGDIKKKLSDIQNLNHRNVLKYYSIFNNEKGQQCIITDLAENGELSKFISLYRETLGNTQIPEDIIITIMIQSLSGLSYIHSKKIFHRNIKPSNLFMSNKKEIRIGDLADENHTIQILKLLKENDGKEKKSLRSTANYMAPEILCGEKYEEKSDVFSLGACFFELITLDYPKINTKTPRNIKEVKYINIEIINNFVENSRVAGMVNVIKKMLIIDPKSRPSAMECLKSVRSIYLKNFSNLTSFEAALRCLHSSKIFNQWCDSQIKCGEINIDEHTKPVSYIVVKAISKLNQGKTKANWNNFLETSRTTISMIKNEFHQKSGEIDFYELIKFFRKEMHSELNLKVSKIDCPGDCRFSPKNDSHLFYYFLKKAFDDNSIISKLFSGTIKHIYECSDCKYQFNEYKTFPYLIYDIQEVCENKEYVKIPNQPRLEECLQYYEERKQEIEKSRLLKCHNCKKVNSFYRKRYLYKLPHLFMVFLKNNGENECLAHYLINGMDLINMVIMNKDSIYDLIGVVNKVKKEDNSDEYISFHRKPFEPNEWYYSDTKREIKDINYNNLDQLYYNMRGGKNGVTIFLLYQSRNPNIEI